MNRVIVGLSCLVAVLSLLACGYDGKGTAKPAPCGFAVKPHGQTEWTCA